MKSKNKQKKKITTLALLLILLIIVITVIGISYARYVSSLRGIVSANAAKMICNLQVDSSGVDGTIVNPYCMVRVKDFNSLAGNTQEVTEVDVQYTITVVAKQDENGQSYVLPAYYWEDSNGTIIAHSTQISGTFTKGNAATHEYKIVFLNNGEEQIKKYVDFNLVAIQGPRSE